MKTAFLLVDSRGPEILHRAGITAPDAFIYIAIEDESPVVFFDAREYDVQLQKIQQIGNGVRVERLEPYIQKTFSETLIAILKHRNISQTNISRNMPYGLAHEIEYAGISISIHDFESERDIKTEQEIAYMTEAQRVNESAFLLVSDILTQSVIEGDSIVYEGKELTSEYVKFRLRSYLLQQGYDCPDGIIVASGEQTARPHDEGEGKLFANESIIIDIFPRSEKTGFFADMTRTFVKGKPKEELEKLFSAVQEVQKEIADSISLGEICSAVHARTVEAFQKRGYPTSPEKGFMHGTGHSLGLSVHEGPRLNAVCDRIIEPGMALTVEPGLYYPGVGGVRIEDVVIFHFDGTKENITRFTKPLLIV